MSTLCKTLGVSTSGFYAWLVRPPSAHKRRDEELSTKINAIHVGSRETYGRPRVHVELRDVHGEHVGGKRVARLMRQSGLEGASPRKKYHTTRRDKDARPAPDLVEREFSADGPNKLWVADITYIPAWLGFLHLSVVVDVWSRRVVGWAMASHLRLSRTATSDRVKPARRRMRRSISAVRAVGVGSNDFEVLAFVAMNADSEALALGQFLDGAARFVTGSRRPRPIPSRANVPYLAWL